ncbi:aminotransferase [Phaffia rhodozyma]|uniref:Aminotransferase n=1 Tax=Phaffia rhodozyma TaxID=264483 RepID=A0A0F7SGN6_PHARH|nr:aminotransferase [Phaffia rhodozyma]
MTKSVPETESVHKPTHEGESEAHKLFRGRKGHGNHKSGREDEEVVPGIVHPGATGVIYCSERASANGFTDTSSEWSNMGQGAPEVGHIPDAPERNMIIDINALGGDAVNEYAPTAGVKELRSAVANLYNVLHREGKSSKYTHENVCIVPGGRSGMSRVAAVVGDVFCGYQLPEYTAYSDSLSVFKRLVPIPTVLSPKTKYELDMDALEQEIKDKGLSVIVASNPRNPTGQTISGEKLNSLVELTRKQHITTILDEFYSFYNYEDGQEGQALSSAKYVDDVNDDNVVIIDGLTKGFRLPGWRVCWVVGPKELISAVSQSGSFLDGGASHVLQVAAISMLEPSRVKQDIVSLQKHFKMKRDYCLKRLEDMGLPVEVSPVATFYLWLNLESLPEPLNNGLTFFEELLKEKCICVPGIFFDVNPSHRRDLFHSPCHHYVRLSFGPPLEQLEKGMDAIERIVKRSKDELSSMGKSFAPLASAIKKD